MIININPNKVPRNTYRKKYRVSTMLEAGSKAAWIIGEQKN